jgi:hypothetical protein
MYLISGFLQCSNQSGAEVEYVPGGIYEYYYFHQIPFRLFHLAIILPEIVQEYTNFKQ